jgi:hypothetical protein
MLASVIAPILLVTGIVTALPVLQFIAPGPALRLLYKLELRGETELFFARHWGLLAGAMGGLLIYASGHPAARTPIVVAAMLEKAGLVGLISAGWNQPHTRGMRLVFAFDLTCTLLYGAWLLNG